MGKSSKGSQLQSSYDAMPAGAMQGHGSGEMPQVDMNAAVANVSTETAQMPAGSMMAEAGGDMPAGAMEAAVSAASSPQDMPRGDMAGGLDEGMPMGGMNGPSGAAQAWHMDLAPQGCGCG